MSQHFTLLLLHYFFIVSHVGIILFSLFGWMFDRTRKAHLIFLFLIVFSWFILGTKYGYGYCFWTDWHWEIRRHLGQEVKANSFVEYILESMTGRDWNSALVDWITALSLVVSAAASIYKNFATPTAGHIK